MIKKLSLLLATAVGAFSIVHSLAAQNFVLRVGSVAPASSPWGKAADMMKREVEKESGGRLKVETFMGGALGNEDTLLTRVRMGSLQGVALTGSGLYKVLPELETVELPFLFANTKEARYVMDKYVGPYLFKNLPSKGYFTNAVAENGMRHMIGEKFFRKPGDFTGVKIASWPSPVHLDTWRQLGANAIPTPYTELFSSLQRRYTQAADNSIVAIGALSLTTRTKHLTLSAHSFQPGVVMLDYKIYQKLPKDLKALLAKKNKSMAQVTLRKLLDTETVRMLNLFKRMKVNVLTLSGPERAALGAKTKVLRDKALKGPSAKFFKGLLAVRDQYRKGK